MSMEYNVQDVGASLQFAQSGAYQSIWLSCNVVGLLIERTGYER